MARTRPRRRPGARRLAAVLLGAASCLALAGRARAGEPGAAPVAPLADPAPRPPDEDGWRGPDGRLHRLYRPQFIPAPDLFADVQSFGLPQVELGIDRVRSRLVLTASGPPLAAALEALAWLDVPSPEALIEVALVETARRTSKESGGHLLFDRGLPAGAPDTFFRSLRYDFEPDAWLRSQLLGASPFQGASVDFGRSAPDGFLAGTVQAVLRGLAHEGEAEFLTAPALVCTEGVPARLEATTSLPLSLFTRRTGLDPIVEQGGVEEKAGIVLEITADKIGTDRLRVTIHPWLRQVEASSAEAGPVGYPVLGVRELRTTLELADGETLVMGGVEGLKRLRERSGLPGLHQLPGVDSLLAANSRGGEEYDLLFLVRARILKPGRPLPACAPPSEGARLARPAGKAGASTVPAAPPR